ncbi:P-loop containing nucleoside triphosphate hydrolase protein [Phycomyces blakesleeanus]|uniref:P-loop containing nucleoside triphosphate hydrolase protein n=1 Tax=Phycomyces blakesleeanus TaxID=4837 RepID=A0ABR3ALJ2_PHYBL
MSYSKIDHSQQDNSDDDLVIAPRRLQSKKALVKSVKAIDIYNSEDEDTPFASIAQKRKQCNIKSSSESDFDDETLPKRKQPKHSTNTKRRTVESNDEYENEDQNEEQDNQIKHTRLHCIPGKGLPRMSRITHGYNPVSALRRPFVVPFKNKEQSTPSMSGFGLQRTLGMPRRRAEARPMYDFNADGALILWDPEKDVVPEELIENEDKEPTPIWGGRPNKSIAEMVGLAQSKAKKTHVVVDPNLVKILRPHQVEGLKFLYRCTTGKVNKDAFGCIMADEMGLGKTLQCIALIWTLLRQSEVLGKPTVQKIIITCPSSLVLNWANEFVKWLGEMAIRPLVLNNTDSKEKTAELKQWAAKQGQLANPVLIISYESLRAYGKCLSKCPIGLLLCDEGHRLKNGDSLLFQELNRLQVKRRVILSGTPIQNDLNEYYSLFNFVNPGLLGTPTEFRRNYENPIAKGRDADASDAEREKSDKKVAEFWSIVSKFTIRRTNDLLTKYLPVKYEHVVFCQLAPVQKSLYKTFLDSPETKKLLQGTGAQPLKYITMLKKLCNHPGLLDLPREIEGSEKILPSGYISKSNHNSNIDASLSGKFMVLERMLSKIKNETKDKIVLISNYTQTLDLFESYCQQKRYGVLRLDGTLNAKKRQKLVDQFNDPEGEEFIFLLSSKAGGCGLNLIGANRLVLFDPDWNPAADQQALARVWRDGQKKDCFIYRLIGAGTIEEKIFQRQSHKQSLSNCVVDEATESERHFSVADMRQLFQLNTESECETHDTFKCKRCISGKQYKEAESMNYGDCST